MRCFWWSVYFCPSYRLVKSLNKPSETPRRYKVWFVPSFGHTKNYIHHIQEIHDFLKSLLDKHWVENVLVICHDKNDYWYLRKHFPWNVNAAIVQDGPTVSKAYSSCQNTITVRAHWVIFSAACNCNCSIINLSNKIKSLHQFHYGTGDMPDFPIFDLPFHETQLNEWVLPLSK